jgi:urease accessory protein
MAPMAHPADPAAAPALLHLLLLGDGRLPAGGHVHSGGVESAVADGRVRGLADLAGFVRGRLETTGLVEAALAAATTLRLGEGFGPAGLGGDAPADRPSDQVTLAGETLAVLDAEAEARLAAPPLRQASRRLGRQLARVAARCWPHPLLDALAQARPRGAHQPVALGVVGVAAGLAPLDVARLAVHHAVATPAQAGVRLLGIDPFEVAALTARLAHDAEAVAQAATLATAGPLADLPARTGPLVEVAAVGHATWDVRLFAT